jgi:MYXO-CTERM domain-containing protein
MVAESSTFWLGGSYNGAFAGVTSSEPFNEVLITQQSTHFPNVHLDDIHFGPPIPSAPAVALLAGGALLTRRRRE